jgi:3-deoxy-D-manno-octulosonate 8-phosphate phosphatase (KDO 8-P phosphatase)
MEDSSSLYLSPDAAERARRVRLVIFDVDGVLTDGTIWFFPLLTGKTDPGKPAQNTSPETRSAENPDTASATPADAGGLSMVEVKGFSAHDGIGMTLARRAGLRLGVITKRQSESLAMRARDLRLDFVRQGIERKLEALNAVMAEAGLDPNQVCCMGDDIIDLPMLQRSGLAAAPANARAEVRAAAHFVAAHNGGAGAARDLLEFILRQQNRWDEVASTYIREAEGK